MIDIFKWFFLTVGVVILVYVLIILSRSILSVGGNFLSVATSTTTTSTGGVTSIFDTWLKNFRPFSVAPISVVPDTVNGIYKSSSGAYYNSTTVTDRLIGEYQRLPDFDTRWGGGYYNTQPANTDTSNNSRSILENKNPELFKIYLEKYSSIQNDQVISGYAYYELFSNRVFPVYILDNNKKIIGEVKAFANGDLKNYFVPFRAVLSYEPPATEEGYIVFQSAEKNKTSISVIPIFFKYHISQMPSMIFSSGGYRLQKIYENQKNYNGLNNRCVIAGCRLQFCVEQNQVQNIKADCTYRPEFACYQRAICERNNINGKCGWKVDNTLASCLANN